MASPGGTFWFRKRKSEGVNESRLVVQSDIHVCHLAPPKTKKFQTIHIVAA